MSSATPDYSAYDLLDVPIMAIVRRRIVYANDALLRVIGVQREQAIGYEVGSGPHSRIQVGSGMLTARQLMDKLERGDPLPRDLWVQMEIPRGSVRTSVRVTRAPGEQAWMITMLDAPGLTEARRLLEAMIQLAPEMLRSRTEDQALGYATRLMAQQGLFCNFLFLRGAELVHGPMYQLDEPRLVVEQMYGRPLTEVSFPLALLPHLEPSFQSRRATFHNDALETVRPIHPPEIFAFMEQALPRVPMMDAPIFVEGKPYGVLAVMGTSLTPATALSVELFCQTLGSAIEGALHTQQAEHRVSELERLQRELLESERLATLGQAGAVVAHEVRNPLGAIINAVAVLNRDHALQGDSARMVQVIEEEALRLDRMVGDLLAFARPLELRPTPCHLEELVQRVIGAVRAERPDVEIQLLPGEELAPVRADPDLLQMALGNLIRNGVQASPRGGHVRVELFVGSERAGIRVHDEGPGVAPPDADRIFAPFFTTRATGTGLGLSVVHRVATAHRGTVSVSRSRFGGAEFTLELPVDPG